MFLLDTNVVSELRKAASGRAAPEVVAWAEATPVPLLYVSVITLHELEIGVRRKEHVDAEQGQVLRSWLEEQVVPAFAGRVLPVGETEARAAAAFHVPDPAPFRDALIGATAECHGLTVVTRNVRDFERFGAAVLDPWVAKDPG